MVVLNQQPAPGRAWRDDLVALPSNMGCCAHRGKGRLSRGECARTGKRALRRAPKMRRGRTTAGRASGNASFRVVRRCRSW
jgi:hypothetical protein